MPISAGFTPIRDHGPFTVFIHRFVQRFYGQLDAMVLLDGYFDQDVENITIIQGFGKIQILAFDQIDCRHGRGNSPRAAQHLVAGIGNDVVVNFEKHFHGVPARAEKLRHLIGVGHFAHVRFFHIVLYGCL